MIIPRQEGFSESEIQEVEAILAEFHCALKPIKGRTRTIYAIHGDERDELMINRLEGLDYIARVDTIQSPYKLMDSKSELARHDIHIAGKVPGKDFLVIAGQCTIDPANPNYFYETAAGVKEAGADVLRGGVWKPRTSPHSYQGDSRAIEILIEARNRTGLPVNAEIMDEDQLKIAVQANVDMIQVGARNALNYSLLKRIGELTAHKNIAVLLKRGMHMGPINEFLCAAEYIVSHGNPNVMLCPRGTLPAMDGYRNYPDECMTPLLKQKTWAPVVVDPSHSVGKATYVPQAALAAVAYGANGVCIETHCNPRAGIGDDPKQAITPEVLGQLIKDARILVELRSKYMQYLPASA